MPPARVLFELLSGEKPFGKSPAEILMNMEQRGPADIRQLNPNATPGLKAIIDTALSFKPDRRYASAAEFSRALAAEPISGDEATISGNEPTIATAPLRAGADAGIPRRRRRFRTRTRSVRSSAISPA